MAAAAAAAVVRAAPFDFSVRRPMACGIFRTYDWRVTALADVLSEILRPFKRMLPIDKLIQGRKERHV
jgi:hypothetical protein